MVLEFGAHADVPIFRIVFGLFEEDFVVHDRALALLFLEQRLGGLAQAGEMPTTLGAPYKPSWVMLPPPCPSTAHRITAISPP
jgi:hypothetical protein